MEPDASDAEVRKAYRQAAKRNHPDKGGDAETFKKINEAWQVLGDPEKRQARRLGRHECPHARAWWSGVWAWRRTLSPGWPELLLLLSRPALSCAYVRAQLYDQHGKAAVDGSGGGMPGGMGGGMPVSYTHLTLPTKA